MIFWEGGFTLCLLGRAAERGQGRVGKVSPGSCHLSPLIRAAW